jgi:hypothetical protein
VDVHDDAVVLEGDVGVIRVDEAGGVGVAAHVVASVRGVEELGAKGTFEGLGGDLDLDSVGGYGGQQESAGQKVKQGRGLHELRIRHGEIRLEV